MPIFEANPRVTRWRLERKADGGHPRPSSYGNVRSRALNLSLGMAGMGANRNVGRYQEWAEAGPRSGTQHSCARTRGSNLLNGPP